MEIVNPFVCLNRLSKVNSESKQTSKMKFITKIVKG